MIERANLGDRRIFYAYNQNMTAKTRRVMEKYGLAWPASVIGNK